jgi:hypothetical protein
MAAVSPIKLANFGLFGSYGLLEFKHIAPYRFYTIMTITSYIGIRLPFLWV